MAYNIVIEQLKEILSQNVRLRQALTMRLDGNALENPDLQTNPIRSLDELYNWFNMTLTSMPWMGLETKGTTAHTQQNLFYRIDQSIGYAYYLFGDLQYEPVIAEWWKQYNRQWAEYLNSGESWNNDYYELAKSDSAFELIGDKYESPENWHTWNEFFARKLSAATPPPIIAEGLTFPWLDINNGVLNIKTARIDNITDLLGDSPYKKHFANGKFTHITLDVHNYHRFHSPVNGTIVDIQDINGYFTAGGKIIWDKELCKYRYEQQDNIGFQMIEKRVAIVIEIKDCCAEKQKTTAQKNEYANAGTQAARLIAIIPVGVAQVGSIHLSEGVEVGSKISQGHELGCFLFGGSDIVVLTNQNYDTTRHNYINE